MRTSRMLAAGTLVLLMACGSEATHSISSGKGEDGRASRDAGRQSPTPLDRVDPVKLATRWRVVQTSAPTVLFLFEVGGVVEFRPGGTISADAGELDLTGSWSLKADGTHVEITTEAGSTVSAVSMDGDLLRLTEPAGQSTALRRYLGPPQGPLPESAVLDERKFSSLVREGRVESATVTQSGRLVIVNGVYSGDSTAERYSVTLQDCHFMRSLDVAFRQNGVLTDGLPASELQC